MNKLLALVVIVTLVLAALVGCAQGGQASQDNPTTQGTESPQSVVDQDASNFNTNREITVISRESGSGTRGAFIELTGVEVRGEDGTVTDMTSLEATIGNGTNAIMTNVSSDVYAIGYISTGSVNDTIRPLSVDGVAPTAENILAGSYVIARPFIIVTAEDIDPLTREFIDFIMSELGQEIVAERYIPAVLNAPAFQSAGHSGTIVIGGSTSVAPVMERLSEGYRALNPNANIEVHVSGSGAGITGTIDGLLDIGMSSREIRDSEMEQLGQQITICMDGIAVIVNNNNPITDITSEQVRQVFTGELSRWADIQ
ncbi:MAG: substrate-binding domain-containing protein [Oscillospiraceae bacterium]|nr:substrate-binding domain-containing protein [Oscillospiraceae bacterium]